MGESEVVGVAVLVEETEEIVRWMLQCLKDRNPELSPRVTKADKDFNETVIVKELFPSATVLFACFTPWVFLRGKSQISLYHYRREHRLY